MTKSVSDDQSTPPKQPVFGIRADGKVIHLGFSAASIAEAVAQDLFSQGHRIVEIVDYSSGEVVKSLSSTLVGSPKS